MFSRFIKNEMESRDGDNNELGQLGDPINLIINTQFLENNDTCRFFNPRNQISPNTPIFIQSEPNYSTNENINRLSRTNSHEHLMLLAATAVNSSPSNDSCKSSNNQTDNLISNGESPHFSIHDPPLIRLSPTSPNNLFRHDRFNEEFAAIPNPLSNTPFSPTSVDWLGQELYVKAENNSGDLSHSNLKQHSFTNSLSDNDLPTMIRRGRANFPRTEIRDTELQQNSPTHFRSRRDLKRKRSSNPDIEFTHIVNGPRNNTSNTTDGRSSNFNTDTFIDLTGPEAEANVNNLSHINERLTPELSNRHYQWWPFKKHCGNANSNLQSDLDNSLETLSLPTPELISTSSGATSPAIEDIQMLPQFTNYSSPFYGWSSNSEPCINLAYSNTIHQNNEVSNDEANVDVRPQVPRDPHTVAPNFITTSIETSFTESRNSRPNVSSYLRHVLVPQLRNRGRYMTPPNIPTTTRDLNQQYLSPAVSRINMIHATNNFGSTDSGSYFPSIRRTSSGSYVQSTIYDPNRNITESNPQQNYSNRPYSYFRQSDSSSINSDLLSHESFNRAQPVGSTLNSFLRACGLEEVRQRRQAEDNAVSGRQDIDSILSVNNQQMHPLMRLSERNFLNVMLDHRSPSQFSHPFAMYESQGNMESVIQLALHLETSWRGINPSELAQLPCHYYKYESVVPDKDSEKQDKCMVCLEEFVENDHLRTLSCSHQYHVMCVDKWLKMNRTCPMCRADATLGSSSFIIIN